MVRLGPIGPAIPVLLAVVVSSWASESARPAEAVRAAVSIPPQRYFLERIGGIDVEVDVMVGPGESPATYEPRPRQLAALREADVYFTIGVPFESAWLPRFTGVSAGMHIVDMAAGIERMRMPSHGHDHGEVRSGDHADPHVWLAPSLARVLARNTFEALAALRPGKRAELQANLDRLLIEIEELDARLEAKLRAAGRRHFMVQHPTWGYFAREYGLEMIPIEVDGQEPSASELADCIRAAQAHGIRTVFVQPEFSARPARIIAKEIGADVVSISALDADWTGCLERFGRELAEALDGS